MYAYHSVGDHCHCGIFRVLLEQDANNPGCLIEAGNHQAADSIHVFSGVI